MIVDYYGDLKNWETSKKIRDNFTLKELANNKGNSAIPQYIIDKRVDIFLDMLQEFRNWFNKPMTINCNYRQPAFNKSVNGDINSAHIHACAVDWGITGHTEAQRTNVKKEWESLCKKHGVIGSINYYKNGYHLEAFSDVWFGQKQFKVRDYRGTSSDW